MENRFIELEKKITFQEGEIQDLQESIAHYDKRMKECEKALNLIQQRLNHETLVKSQEDEVPPPHY